VLTVTILVIQEEIMGSETVDIRELEPALTPLESVFRYLQVLEGQDLDEYRQAAGMLDDVMQHNSPSYGSYESHTRYAIDAFIDYQHKQIPERKAVFDGWRKASAAHVVRSMIQGKKFPLEYFDQAVPAVLRTIAKIDGEYVPTKRHKRYLRKEIVDAWSCERGKDADPEIMRRAAEAFKFVGRPRAYGRMMTAVARQEARQR
jgi:hypothetical protein